MKGSKSFLGHPPIARTGALPACCAPTFLVTSNTCSSAPCLLKSSIHDFANILRVLSTPVARTVLWVLQEAEELHRQPHPRLPRPSAEPSSWSSLCAHSPCHPFFPVVVGTLLALYLLAYTLQGGSANAGQFRPLANVLLFTGMVSLQLSHFGGFMRPTSKKSSAISGLLLR